MDTLIDHRSSGMLERADIRVALGVGKPKVYNRRYVEFVGLRRAELSYIVHNNSVINLLRALVERVYFIERVVDGQIEFVHPPQPKRDVFYNNMKAFRHQLWTKIRPVSRMCLQEFVETSPPHKRQVYVTAMKDYLFRGMPASAAWVTSFIKAEKVSLSKKADPAPRVIQPRGVVFNLIFGCFIRPAEKAIYKAIDQVYGRPTVVCGQNAHEQAAMLRSAWDELNEPVAISLDLSRMDQHISDVALRWEHSTYRRMFANDPKLSTLKWCLDATVRNEGRAYVYDEAGNVNKVKYRKNGSRMSGDMNTSLGNKLIMCGLLYSYYVDYLGYKPRVDINVVDNGDDCVVIMSRDAYADMLTRTNQRKILERYALTDPDDWSKVYLAYAEKVVCSDKLDATAWFETMGFTLKVEGVVTRFEKIEFCQTQPCFIDGRWLMVRTLKALSKDCYCLKPISQAQKWIEQVGNAGLVCYGSVPIYSAFYKTMPRSANFDRQELYGSGMYYLSRDMTSSGVVTSDNRVAFYNTFGVTPREQELIEETYMHMKYGAPDNDSPGLYLPLPV